MIIASFSSRGRERETLAELSALAGAIAPEPPTVLVIEATDDPVAGVTAGLPALRTAVAADGERPLVLVGECSLVPAVLAATLDRHPGACLIWVDAHGDLNTPETSPSQFAGGMPLGVIVGLSHPAWRQAGGLADPFPPERVALVGARDLDPGEREVLDRIPMHEVDSCRAALAALPADAPLYVHLDTDVLDPSEVPGAGFPAPDGWSSERFLAELAPLAESGRVVAISVCPSAPPELDARLVHAVTAR